MKLAKFASLLVCVAGVQRVEGQPTAGVVQSLRAYGRDVGERLVLGVRRLDEDQLASTVAASGATVATTILDVSRRTERYCAAVAGIRPPVGLAGSGTTQNALALRLQRSFAFCDSALAPVSDEALGQIASATDYEFVLELQRSRAFVATQMIALWSSADESLRASLRINGIVPPRVCIGGGDCDSGANVCRAGVPPKFGGTVTLSDAPFSVTSDGRGPYLHRKQGSTVELGTSAALVFTSIHDPNSGSLRSFAVDLNKPVPGGGGSPLGVLTVPSVISDDRATAAAGDTSSLRSTYASLFAQWYTEPNQTVHSVTDIPVGTTVEAEQMDVNFTLNGVAHLLQMGSQPMWHCYTDKPRIHGDGTTRARISRPTANQYVLDLPTGSIGRLFDVHLLPANAVDRGLYYVSLHLVINAEAPSRTP